MEASATIHRNVYLGILVQFVLATFFSLGLVTDAFVLEITDNSNWLVGVLEGSCGSVALLVTVITGILSDRLGRSPLLRSASIFAMLYIACILVTLFYLKPRVSSHSVYLGILSGAVINGAFRGCYMAPAEALYGDSTPPGAVRAVWYSRRSQAMVLGLGLGPGVAATIFAVCGNQWTEDELISVIVAGCVVAGILAMLLLFFQDIPSVSPQTQSETPSDMQDRLLDENPAAVSSAEKGQSNDEDALKIDGAPVDAVVASQHNERWGVLHSRHVPYFLSLSSILMGMGSGMSVKFILIFCWKELGLRPIATHLIQSGVYLLALFGNPAILGMASQVGPISATIIFRILGVGAMLVLAFVTDSTVVAVVAVLVRGGLMNSTTALVASVLNDHVSKSQRGKWAVVSMLGKGTWSGSALLGGFLVDTIGFRHMFAVTAVVHFMSSLALCPIVPLVDSLVELKHTQNDQER